MVDGCKYTAVSAAIVHLAVCACESLKFSG